MIMDILIGILIAVAVIGVVIFLLLKIAKGFSR